MSKVIIGNYHKLVLEEILDKTKGFVSALVVELQDNTPVDTGWARASWQAGPDGFSPFILSPGEYGDPGPPNLDFMQNEQSVDIANTAPHIVALNEGHSQQAPPKFIEKTINDVTSDFK